MVCDCTISKNKKWLVCVYVYYQPSSLAVKYMAVFLWSATKTVPQTVATFYLMHLKWPRADMHTTRTKYFEVYHQSSHQDGHSNNPFATSYLLLKLHSALHWPIQDKQSLIYFINPDSGFQSPCWMNLMTLSPINLTFLWQFCCQGARNMSVSTTTP